MGKENSDSIKENKFLKLLRSPLLACILISVIFVLLSVFLFRRSYVRLYESFKDLVNSFRYYGHVLFGTKKEITATVTLIPDNFYSWNFMFDVDWNVTGVRWASWWFSLWNGETWKSFSDFFLIFLFYFLEIVMVLILIGVLLFFVIRSISKSSNKGVGENSKPLSFWLFVKHYVFYPVKIYFVDLWDFIKHHKVFYISWIVLWSLNFNFFVIGLEFLSYYFYFIVSFDFRHLWIQLVKLFGDLSPMLTFIPIWLWVIFILIFIRRRRINRGYAKLESFENYNKEFVASLGVSTLLCGEMGVGKTSTMTDMALSLSQYFRYEAFSHLLNLDLMFPNFPWSVIENEINNRILIEEGKDGRIFNLASCEAYFGNEFLSGNYFGYDLDHERSSYYDGKKLYYLEDTVITYAKLYFIYICESSLIISNYSIREDNIKISDGYFPLWNEDFYRKKFQNYSNFSKFSHILDFDSVRLGNTVNNSKFKDSLEFGVVVITEGGKERLNQIGLQGIKKDSFEANQKNDLFDMWLKLYRHSATVDNFCFGKILIDEQRPMSLGADLREVCQDVIFIKSEEKNLSVLPFKFFGSAFFEKLASWFEKRYYNYKEARGDNTLFMYLVKFWSGFFIRHENKWNNLFGYSKLTLSIESGDLDTNHSTSHTYYLCYHKIFSDRYASDCFNSFFYSKAIQSSVGLNDMPSYHDVTANVNELKNQNSYFVNSLVDNIFSSYLFKEEVSSSENEEVIEAHDFKEGEDPVDSSTGATTGKE